MDLRARFRPRADFEHLRRGKAAEFGTAEGRHVAEAVFGEPLPGPLIHDHRGDRIDAARQAFAGDQHVRHDAVGIDAPHFAGAHEAGLHLIGDIERADFLAGLLDRREIAGQRHREAIGRRNRLHDHAGRIADRDRRRALLRDR